MRILISYESGVPIYEQIESEIRGQIIRGDLPSDTLLPSIRTLAKELKVGVITAKRAYDDLAAEGFIYAVQGKGMYVATVDKGKAESYAVTEIRAKLKDIACYAEKNSVDKTTIKKLMNEVWEDI
jgi:GntR family transcriptional regulator